MPAELSQGHSFVVAQVVGDDAKAIGFDERRGVLTLAGRSEVTACGTNLTAVLPASFKE